MTKNIYWILKMDVGEGNAEALKDLVPKFCEITEKEDGAVAYEWFLSADEKTLHIYERYADSDAALVHLGNVGPHLGELMALATPTLVECYGPASDAFKDAVKSFPIVYFDQFAGFSK